MIKKYFSQLGRFLSTRKATAAFTLCSAVALFVLAVNPVFALETGIEFGEATGLGSQDIRVTIMQIVRIILGFVGILAILIIIYAGFTWMTSGGSPEKIDTAKRTLRNGVIGLAIILSAFAIASFIINALIGATSGGPVNPDGQPPTECENCWYLGGGIIESVYPTPFARDIPRNTSIIVTFKVPMSPNTIIENASTTCTTVEPCEGQLNADNVKIFPYEAEEDEALASNEVLARSTDGKTFTFVPNELLGNSLQNTWYATKLKTGIRKDNNEAAFPSGNFEWRFEVGTLVDIDPVEVSRVFPYADKSPDIYSFSEAVAATGRIQINSQPNIDQAATAVLVSSTTGSPNATINGIYNGQYEGSVTLTMGANAMSASWNPARQGAPTSFAVSNNVLILGDGVSVSFNNNPASGNQFTISLAPQRNADTLRIGSRVYTFVASSPDQNQIQRGVDTTATISNVVSKINNDSFSPVSSDAGLSLTAKTAGASGNSIALQVSGSWATITPMSGGANAGLGAQVQDKPDQPRNVIITIDFNEPIDPTRINLDTVKVEYLPPCTGNLSERLTCLFSRIFGVNNVNDVAVAGRWEISNNYKTINFIPNELCVDDSGNSAVNACGEDIYCLPVHESPNNAYSPTQYRVTIKAGLLKECNSDNECTDNSFRYCVTTPGDDAASVCSNSPQDVANTELAYAPKIRSNALGISDAASNTFNGNKNVLEVAGQQVGRAEGPLSQSGKPPYNLNIETISQSELDELGVAEYEELLNSYGDDFVWMFFVNKNIKVTPPKLESIAPNINKSGASITAPVEGQFDTLMMSSTLKPGSNYRDGYCSCSSDSDCSEGYSCDDEFLPARCVADNKDEQLYCEENNDCSGNNVCLNKKYISFIDRSTSPIGWWVSKLEMDTKTPPDGFANKTKALLNHTRFSEVTSYGAEFGSGVKDIYQNCYLPSDGPNVDPNASCNATALKPYCCNGLAMNRGEWEGSVCFTKP